MIQVSLAIGWWIKGGEWSDAAHMVSMIAMKNVFNQVQRK